MVSSIIQSFNYAIIRIFLRLHALLPMRALYFLSDIFYYIIYYVAKYRRKVVRQNLQQSFPDKTDGELLALEKRFYRHFSDYIFENVKLAHISQEELNRRTRFNNPDIINPLIDKGHTCFMVLMGHYCNWEWFAGLTEWFDDVNIYHIYRPMNNKAFDRLFVYLRTRLQGIGIEKQHTLREIIRLKQSKERSIVAFLADQSPKKMDLHYWTTFLNRESAMINGPERIAAKLDIPVIFVDVKKVKRGYYTVDFELITDTPRQTPEFWITEQYTRLLERSILRDPAYWLWTHKRWKHGRQ